MDTGEEVEENSDTDSKVIVDRAMDITLQQETLGDEGRDDDTGEAFRMSDCWKTLQSVLKITFKKL